MSSLAAVKLQHATREALTHFIADRHMPDDVAEIILHMYGGGPRGTTQGSFPATWAVVVCTRGHDHSFAFDRCFGWEVGGFSFNVLSH